MNISSLASPALVVDPDDPVSRVGALLLRTKRPAAIVARGRYYGVVRARALARRRIATPDTEKIRSYIEPAPLLPPGASLEHAANAMVLNRQDALPLQRGGRYLLVDKLAVLGALAGSASFAALRAKDIMRPAICANAADSLGAALATIRDAGITHLPVVSDQNRLEGIVETADALRRDVVRTRARRGEIAGEKVKLGAVPVTAVMARRVLTVLPDAGLPAVIGRMVAAGAPTVVVVDSDTTLRVRGIITPTPLLKLIGTPVARRLSGRRGQGPHPEAGVYLNLSGFQDEDPFVLSAVDAETTAFIRKVAKLLPVDYLVLHQDRHEEKRSHRMRHDVKARLITEKGFFFAHGEAWDTGKAVRQTLDRLMREAVKQKEKAKGL